MECSGSPFRITFSWMPSFDRHRVSDQHIALSISPYKYCDAAPPLASCEENTNQSISPDTIGPQPDRSGYVEGS